MKKKNEPIKNLDYSRLDYLSDEQVEQVKGLIEGKINPEFYESVQQWIRQCYNPPHEDELIMCALDEVMECHGVEAINGEWQNGYWCDILATYVNTGDMYTATVINHRDDGFIITSWGDLIEEIENRKE